MSRAHGEGALAPVLFWCLLSAHYYSRFQEEHEVNMSSLFQFSVGAFDVFTLRLTAEFLLLICQEFWEAWSCLFWKEM